MTEFVLSTQTSRHVKHAVNWPFLWSRLQLPPPLPSHARYRPSGLRPEVPRSAAGTCGIPSLQVWIDSPIACSDDHPARFAPPRGRRDNRAKIFVKDRHLRLRIERSFVI